LWLLQRNASSFDFATLDRAASAKDDTSKYRAPCAFFSWKLESMAMSTRLNRVLEQLALYEHPLLKFDAREKGEGVEVIISFKDSTVPVHTYYFDLHPRDLDHPNFEWAFQRQLYDCLHDYFVEMFIRTPQDREERRRRQREQQDAQ